MTSGRGPKLTRRRTLRLFAAASGLALPGPAWAGAAPPHSLWRWHGTALGAEADLTLVHPDRAEAKRLVGLALAEVERLEAIFSLYRPDSALARLNARGRLDAPPLELVELLGRAQAWSRRTGGAFDVTVQPLWALYRRHFAAPGADPDGPPPRAVARAARLVDYRALAVAPDRIRLERPGMAITLNGIAQGYITDRVAELLRAAGLDRVLVALGETRALGPADDGRPWRVALAGAERGGPLGDTIALSDGALSDGALATSSAAGLRFDPEGRFHHLFDPQSGACAESHRRVSVIAAQACDADALSTALAVAGRIDLSEDRLAALGIGRIFLAEGEGPAERLL